MADFQVVMYRTDGDSELIPKCDKCNDKRQIEFLSPTQKLTYENCECLKYNKVYKPVEYICTSFQVNRDDGCMAMWYRENHESDYDYYSYGSSDYANTIYKEGMEYKDLNDYKTYFKTKEECQGYCDYLNKIEIDKSDTYQF